MLLEYPCAMQRKNHFWRRKGDLYQYAVTVAIVFFIFTDIISTAPTFDNSLPQSQSGEIAEYFSEINGCYYNFQRYEEGDRIVTNEPCLNCTCHNRMLMCYLRVCPFTKAIGQDCTIEKKPDQCCPIITCPEVPVKLLTSSTTSSPAPITSTTEIGFHDNYGCTINNSFYADGAQVPSDAKKPCELCYCIRNHTACVMQECTLHVEGCKPVYQDGVCCPVRYECDYDKETSSTPRLESTGGLIKSTTVPAVVDCQYGNQVYSDGELIVTEKPCEHCYCMRGDIVCAVQDCGEPLRGKDCIPTTPPPEKCCPSSYACANETTSIEDITKLAEELVTTTEYRPETTYRPKHTSTILTNEQIYEKLGENTTPLSTEKAPEKPSSKIPPKHPSEDIQLDNNSIDAGEHFTEESIIGTTSSNDKSTEKLVTEENDDQIITTSQLPLASKTPSEDLIAIEPAIELTSTEGKPNISLLPSNQVQDVSTVAPAIGLLSSVGTTVETVQDETTKYEIEKEPNLTVNETQFYSTSEKTISSESATEEKIPVTTLTNSKPEQPENKPFEEQQDESSSESSRFQSTTRQFNKSTMYAKEPETTKAPEDLQITTKIPLDNTKSPIDAEKEQQTENINTVTHESTDSLLDNITKIISSIQSGHQNPIDQLTKVETTNVPVYSTQVPITSKPDISSLVTENIAEISTIKEEFGTVLPSSIPGEGSCLVDGITYPNGSLIESYNPCHSKCVCLSSIPTCTLITCAPPPNHPKCMPIQMKPESCCPAYICNNDNESSVHVPPPIESQKRPDQQETTTLLDEIVTEHKSEHSTETFEYNKPTEQITEKNQLATEIENIKPEIISTPSIKPENEVVTEGQKPEYTNVENKIAVTTPSSDTTKPDIVTELSPSQHNDEIENEDLDTINSSPINDYQITEQGSTNKLNYSSQEVPYSTETPSTPFASESAEKISSTPFASESTEKISSTPFASESTEKISAHDDISYENEIHNDVNEVTTENVLEEASTSIQQVITQDPLTKNNTIESSTSPSVQTVLSDSQENVQSDLESDIPEKESETTAKITTTESSVESNVVSSTTTETKEEQKYTESPSSTEPGSTVYLDEKIDINPTTLPSKISEEQNDATENNIFSSTDNINKHSQGFDELITTSEQPAIDSQSIGTTTYGPQSSISDIINELQNDLITKTYETYTSTETISTSELNKLEEFTTTPKTELENVSVAETTIAASTEYQNNNDAAETTTLPEEIHSGSNEYASESYSSSISTTEKNSELEQPENTEKINNQEVSEESYVPTTTPASIETTIINEDYNHNVETTEASSHEPDHSSSINYESDVTTEHKFYNTEKPTENSQQDADDHSVSPVVTINPIMDEDNKVNEETAKPVTILPETEDPAITVLPSKPTDTITLILQNENHVTEHALNDYSASQFPSIIQDEIQTRIPETNEIPQQTEITTIKLEPSTNAPSEQPKPESNLPINPLKEESPVTITTEKQQIISTQSTYSYIPPLSSTNAPIQQSTWTRKPLEEETSEPSFYPSGPMYPTGGGDGSLPETISEESEYEEDNSSFGPGTCRYGGKIYVSAQQIPRDDPCDFCFCFRSDIICLQQSCPPPIQGCRQEPISGFCCPRYECPVATALTLNLTSTTSTTTTSTTTTLPPHFPLEAYRGTARRAGCMIHGYFYKVGDDIAIASGPCLDCICGSDGRMKCDPKSCSPEPFVRQIMAESNSKR